MCAYVWSCKVMTPSADEHAPSYAFSVKPCKTESILGRNRETTAPKMAFGCPCDGVIKNLKTQTHAYICQCAITNLYRVTPSVLPQQPQQQPPYKPSCVQDCDMFIPVSTTPYKLCFAQDCNMSIPVTTTKTIQTLLSRRQRHVHTCRTEVILWVNWGEKCFAWSQQQQTPYKPCCGQDSDMDVHTCTRVVILRANWGEKCLAWCQPKSPKSGSSIMPQT